MTTIRCTLLAALLGLSSMSVAEPNVQVGFSPEGSARALVLETIGGAKRSIQMLAYAFQAPDIMQALADAERRGVEVRVVVDKKRNQNKASKTAMDFVTANGVELRTNDHFHLHHDKTIIVDGATCGNRFLQFRAFCREGQLGERRCHSRDAGSRASVPCALAVALGSWETLPIARRGTGSVARLS